MLFDNASRILVITQRHKLGIAKPVGSRPLYLYKSAIEMIWPYDEQGRLMGEDAWETEPSTGELIRLAPEDVVSVEEARSLLNPLIQPLPA